MTPDVPPADTAREEEASPWWPCPDCGSVHFKPAFCTFERGRWVVVGHGFQPEKYELFDPPRGVPTGVAMDVECLNCGLGFNIAKHYGWPIIGTMEATL